MSVDLQDDRPFSPHRKPLLSCAECRRLKLKCTRIWPCNSCEKRGLSYLCPSGVLPTRPRTKQTPSVPHHVVEHINKLQARISQLERSLAVAPGETGCESVPRLFPQSEPQMPYLQKKLLRKIALEKTRTLEGESSPNGIGKLSSSSSSEGSSELEDVRVSLGTLKITPDGRSVFFGPTAVTEGLLVDDELVSDQPVSNPLRDQTVDIVALAETFPFASPSALVTVLQERAKSHLPSLARARELCASYFNYASFVIDVMPEGEWFEGLFQRIYGAHWSEMTTAPEDRNLVQQLHLVQNDELALFFCVLALGALTDLTTEPFNYEAASYYSICRALMTTECVLTEPTICSIRTLALASYYEGLQSQGNSSRNCWSFMTLASKTAHIMGLHRDHSLIGLDDQEMENRRLVFWEVHSMDMIQSLATGRPTCTPSHYMDTCMPIDRHATVDAAGQVEESFYRWKYRFCSQVVTLISDHVLRVKTPNYAATLEADHRISQFSSTFKAHSKPHISNPRNAAQIQMMLGTRETCIMYIHRGFFAKAISIDPYQPEHGKYSRSVLRTFEGARIIIRGMHNFVSSHAKFAARIWFLWNHLLTAIFVVASIAIRAPRCSLSETAFRQLDIAELILKQTASFGGRPKFMLPIIQSLRQKAHNKRSELETGYPQQPVENSSDTQPEENDELAVIGGKTRVLISKQSPSPSPRSQSGSTSSGPTSPPPLQGLGQQMTTAPPDASFDTGSQGSVARMETDAQGSNGHHIKANYINGYSNYLSDNTIADQHDYTVYAPYEYQYHSAPSHYSQANNGSTEDLYVGQAPVLQPVYSQGDYGTTAPHPSTVNDSSYLWHAMLQDLGISHI